MKPKFIYGILMDVGVSRPKVGALVFLDGWYESEELALDSIIQWTKKVPGGWRVELIKVVKPKFKVWPIARH